MRFSRLTRRLSPPIFAAILVFSLGSAVTILTWQTSFTQKSANQETIHAGTIDFASRFEYQIEKIRTSLQDFSIALDGTKITNDSFSHTIESVDFKNAFPGIDVVAYVPIFDDTHLAEFKSTLNARGVNSFDIFPVGKRDQYAPVLFAYSQYNPLEVQSIRGFDLLSTRYSDQIKQIQLTHDTVISEPIDINDPNGETQKGISIFVPIFDASKTEVVGTLAGTVRMGTVASSQLPNSVLNMDINIFFGNKVSKATRVYGEAFPDSINSKNKKAIKIGERTFTVVGFSSLKTAPTGSSQPAIALIIGFTLSGVLAMFFLYLIRSKALELDLKKTVEVQRAKERLLSLASHQLRTPATGVKQYVGMVLEGYAGGISDEQRAMLEKAQTSNERQLFIVNQILKISKLQNERISLHLKLTDPVALAHDVVQEQKIFLADKTVRIETPDSEILVPLDTGFFRMVIENLVNNAAKYSQEDAEITISFSIEDQMLAMRVKDNGIGIAEEDFEKIFEAFTRIDNKYTFNVEGTGIGLYIDKLIVGLHEGTISVESELGKGTTFTVKIPMLFEKITQENVDE